MAMLTVVNGLAIRQKAQLLAYVLHSSRTLGWPICVLRTLS